MPEQADKRRFSSVENSWSIVQYLMEHEQAGITDISSAVGMAKSTVHTHLTTLRSLGIVVQEQQTYRLSLKFVQIGNEIRNRWLLYNAGRPVVDRLANTSQEYVHLLAIDDGEIIYLYGSGGEQAVATEYFRKDIQHPIRVNALASAKAVIAFLPEADRDSLIKRISFDSYTDYTITNESELREELQAIRERGFALNDQEEILGTRAVGAPIFSTRRTVIGSISITKPRSRMAGDDFHQTVPEEIMSAANEIEARVTSETQTN